MTAHVYSATSLGYEGRLIDVESDSSNGLPTLIIVGLGNKAVDEAKERVRSAIKNAGLEFPRKKITINLAPADLPKDGSHLDLPIALAILSISKQIPESALKGILVAGELSLDGTLKPIRGAIQYAEVARDNGYHTIIVPEANAQQASLIGNVKVLGANNLREIFLFTTGQHALTRPADTPPSPIPKIKAGIDAIHGQEKAKRALIIAAAGAHNILFDGPPGSGKTMLARALTTLLPPMSSQEIINVTKLHSLADDEAPQGAITTRPFRSPHHSASMASLIGGGLRAKPGEISLAHHGVLFLDELPEYGRSVLESLRQPLEDRVVHITRANHRSSYPASFMLVATRNPCPCGFADDLTHECTCTSLQILNYQKKISGPLMDRIDLYVAVSPVRHDQLLEETSTDQEKRARAQIAAARKAQQLRFPGSSKTNAELTNTEVKTHALLSLEARQLLDRASKALDLSARSYFKIVKISRTIADLDKSDPILPTHVSEALQYRPQRRTGL